jgi:hypothetical protein
MNSKIKYYPVGNGDMSLITLEDNTTILVDCNIRETAKGESDKTKFDAKADLLNSIKKRDTNYFVDVFVLSHGDQDHCRGFKSNFYQGDPKKYTDKNRKADEIIIDELWFSPMIAEESTNDDEDVIQIEAERRLKLHRDEHADKDKPGNRIVIIGYDGPNIDYKDLDHLRRVPGNIVTNINNKEQTKFSIFIHAPFKEQLKSADGDKNTTSIVFQARFKNKPTDTDFSCLAMFGGDSDHYSWEVILEKTKRKKNHETHKALDWDLFLAPHHCSWSYFNDRPQSENPEPKADSLEVLDFKRTNAIVIASCKKIIDDESNPPHYEAKEEYVKKVGKSKFLNTETDDIVDEAPQPIEFIISAKGPTRPPKGKVGNATNAAGGTGAAGIAIKQG